MNWFNNFLELFIPRLCVVCEDKLLENERFICLRCLVRLPRTDFMLPGENRTEQLFYGRVPIEKGFTYFEFRRGSSYQGILYHLKYKGQKELGEFLGERFGAELARAGVFPAADYLCPVPLFSRKERLRGYNQSDHIALGLSGPLQIPVLKGNLERIVNTSSQTKKSRYERWKNVENSFRVVDPVLFEGKHVVLVDDVLTTGATLEACAAAILGVCQAKISILTLAKA